jgi:hypothetical protein
VLYGGDGNDVLEGGSGRDVLNGGACHDLLIGGGGFDFGTGGKDFDACDSEVASECEKNGKTRVLCSSDGDCNEDERCASHSKFCVPLSAADCGAVATPDAGVDAGVDAGPSCTPVAESDTTCDGIDDDCDGTTDDNYQPRSTVCGNDGCTSTGVTSCVNGAEQDSCAAMTSGSSDATCDNVDDDCDGRIDEGFVTSVRSCGLGVCVSTGGTTCVNGVVLDSCQPGAPTSSTDTDCNGRDDDCDGVVDDDVPPVASSCGVGVCARTGVAACVNGAPTDTCQPGAPTAQTDDSCNGLDDDCNGVVDDAFVSRETTCGFGPCLRHGQTQCTAGRVADSCKVDCEGQCNDGAEDDGDGLIDCNDPDCKSAVGCLDGSFGSPCTNNSQCNKVGSEGFCITGLPAGYCSRPCGSSGCPEGTFCLGDTACVVSCGPGNHCGREHFVCSAVDYEDVPADPLCHADCTFSCPADTTCNPMTYRCE